MDVLGLLGMLPFLAIEFSTLAAYGWGWLSAWNVLDTSTDVLQVRSWCCMSRSWWLRS